MNTYAVISLVRLIAASYSAVMWQLLACAKPCCCYTWPACRYLCYPAWQLVDCVFVSNCVCHLSNKELLYFFCGAKRLTKEFPSEGWKNITLNDFKATERHWFV